MIRNISFGSDPEFFLVNTENNLILASTYLVDGTKEEPHSLEDGYSILRDNILVEGNVPPTYSKVDFVNSIKTLKSKILKYLSKTSAFINLTEDDSKELNPTFLLDPEALQFGCSPYLNAWDEEEHRAKDLSSETFRTAGFHIHIGYDKTEDNVIPKDVMNRLIAKAFDLFVTIPSYAEHFDARRFLNYGGIGQYRDTSYGVECRSLGGYFLKNEYLDWTINQVEKMLDYVSDERNLYNLMYMEKPLLTVNSNGEVNIALHAYEELDISFSDQLVTTMVYNKITS